MSVETSIRTNRAERVPEPSQALQDQRGASPEGPPADIETLSCGREYVIQGRVERIYIPGKGSGEPGRCRIRDHSGSVWLVFPGLPRHGDVGIDAQVRAGGLVVRDERGLAIVDPWVAPIA